MWAISSLLVVAPALAQVSTGDVAVIGQEEPGFAELVRAGKSVNLNEDTPHGRIMYAAVFGGYDCTLAERRTAVNSPDFREALALMREALNSTLVAPTFQKQADVEAVSIPIRRLGYFVACEEELLFAEGKTRAVVDTFAETLQLAEQIKTWSIEGSGIGGAINAIVLRTIARHLDQLSTSDCDLLLGTMRAVLKSPDPSIEGFRAQRNLVPIEVDDAIASVTLKPRQPQPDSEDQYDKFDALPDADREAVVSLRTNNPQGLADFRDSALQRLSKMYDDLADAYINFPPPDIRASSDDAGVPWNRVDFIERFLYAGSLTNVADRDTVSFTGLIDRTVGGRAQLHLVAVHAAILRWRWEHSILPESLQVLKLGSLAIDPFTRQPLIYTRIDDQNYTLSSAGPPDVSYGQQGTGSIKRIPLTLSGLQFGK